MGIIRGLSVEIITENHHRKPSISSRRKVEIYRDTGVSKKQIKYQIDISKKISVNKARITKHFRPRFSKTIVLVKSSV